MNHFPVLPRELACAVRQPGPCVRALCEAVAQILSKNMTSHFKLHSSHFTLALHTCTSHSTLHLISNHVSIETHRTTHAGTTTCCRTQRRNRLTSKRSKPQPPHTHTRYLSSPAATTLHRKIQGCVLRLPSQNKAHAIFMQPWQPLQCFFAARCIVM